MRLRRTGDGPYWILYEGAPGGEFDPSTDYWYDSTGETMSMPAAPQRWNDRPSFPVLVSV